MKRWVWVDMYWIFIAVAVRSLERSSQPTMKFRRFHKYTRKKRWVSLRVYREDCGLNVITYIVFDSVTG